MTELFCDYDSLMRRMESFMSPFAAKASASGWGDGWVLVGAPFEEKRMGEQRPSFVRVSKRT